MLLVSILCFLIFNVIKGDPASLLAGIDASSEQYEVLRAELNMDANVCKRYFNWLIGFLSGNPGKSLRFQGVMISSIIQERLPISVTLAALSLFFILIFSIPASLLTVKRKGGMLDLAVNFLTAALISAPGFFLGLLFIWIFSFTLKLFTAGMYISYNENFFFFLGCLFFPALSIAVPNTAIMIKFLRSSLFAEFRSDYVRTARSKGESRFYILRKHVLKNAMIPAITILGMITAEVLSGSIIIEQVFNIPGIGRLLIAAIGSRDYPLIQALMVYISFIVVTANTLADITIMIIDPRIRSLGCEIK